MEFYRQNNKELTIKNQELKMILNEYREQLINSQTVLMHERENHAHIRRIVTQELFKIGKSFNSIFSTLNVEPPNFDSENASIAKTQTSFNRSSYCVDESDPNISNSFPSITNERSEAAISRKESSLDNESNTEEYEDRVNSEINDSAQEPVAMDDDAEVENSIAEELGVNDHEETIQQDTSDIMSTIEEKSEEYSEMEISKKKSSYKLSDQPKPKPSSLIEKNDDLKINLNSISITCSTPKINRSTVLYNTSIIEESPEPELVKSCSILLSPLKMENLSILNLNNTAKVDSSIKDNKENINLLRKKIKKSIRTSSPIPKENVRRSRISDIRKSYKLENLAENEINKSSPKSNIKIKSPVGRQRRKAAPLSLKEPSTITKLRRNF